MQLPRKSLRLLALQALPAVAFFLAWELMVVLRPNLKFFFGSPRTIGEYLVERTVEGSLVRDAGITLFEAGAGFVLGSIVGTALGMVLWYSRTVFAVARPYIVALGSAPIFALAPLLIIWFGTGVFSKVMTAALSTVFVALLQAYTGAEQVDVRYAMLLKTFRATKSQVFRKIVAPAAVVWVVSAMRLNVGFALLGAFIGEFISSEAGLGHLILVAAGLFNISLVLAGVFVFVSIALLLNWAISELEPVLQRRVAEWL
jgi:NitT/TauT family transport system permease protein